MPSALFFFLFENSEFLCISFVYCDVSCGDDGVFALLFQNSIFLTFPDVFLFFQLCISLIDDQQGAMLGVADGGVAGAVNNPDASQIIICRQIAQFHWEHQHDLWPKSHSHLATQIQTDTKYKYNNKNLISRPITQSSFPALA